VYEHDAVGNLLARRPLSGGPGDHRRHVGRAWQAAHLHGGRATTTFGYDAFGRRAVRSDPTGVTTRISTAQASSEARLEGDPDVETTAGLLRSQPHRA